MTNGNINKEEVGRGRENGLAGKKEKNAHTNKTGRFK